MANNVIRLVSLPLALGVITSVEWEYDAEGDWMSRDTVSVVRSRVVACFRDQAAEANCAGGLARRGAGGPAVLEKRDVLMPRIVVLREVLAVVRAKGQEYEREDDMDSYGICTRVATTLAEYFGDEQTPSEEAINAVAAERAKPPTD